MANNAVSHVTAILCLELEYTVEDNANWVLKA